MRLLATFALVFLLGCAQTAVAVSYAMVDEIFPTSDCSGSPIQDYQDPAGDNTVIHHASTAYSLGFPRRSTVPNRANVFPNTEPCKNEVRIGSFAPATGALTMTVFCSETNFDITGTPSYSLKYCSKAGGWLVGDQSVPVGYCGVATTKHARNEWVSRSHYKGACVPSDGWRGTTYQKATSLIGKLKYLQRFVYEVDELSAITLYSMEQPCSDNCKPEMFGNSFYKLDGSEFGHTRPTPSGLCRLKSSGATSVWQMDKCGRSGTYDNKDCAGEPLGLTGTDYASGPCIVPDAHQHINTRDYATLNMCSNATAFSSWIDSNPADPVSICKQPPQVESAWSAWSTCTCDDTANIIRTRTRMDGSVESESRMCQLVDPCPGVADAEPAKVQMELSGDGLWDWVDANQEEFKASITTDVASTLMISEDKISDIVARLASSLLLQARDALRLLAGQTVEVTFTIQQGASNALTPVELALAYQNAVNNGTANFSSLESASGVKITAKVIGTAAAATTEQRLAGTMILIAIVVFGCCFVVLAAHVTNKTFCSKAKPNTEETPEESAVPVSNEPVCLDSSVASPERAPTEEILNVEI